MYLSTSLTDCCSWARSAVKVVRSGLFWQSSRSIACTRERAAAVASEHGVSGAANEDAARAADLVVIATKSDGAVETARSLREAIGTTPVLSVAAELAFSKEGVFPTPEATSIAQRIQDVVDGPVIAGLHSLAASNLALGHTTIIDCVNPWTLTREVFAASARRSGSRLLSVETRCSDGSLHRARLEERENDVPGLDRLDWQQVVSRDYAPWTEADVRIDTACTDVAAAVAEIVRRL